MFPLNLALGLAGGLLGIGGGVKAATAHPMALDPRLFGAPNESLLDPTQDPGFYLISRLLASHAQQRFASQVPQIASLLQARGLGGDSGLESNMLGNAYNEATAATIPQIAQLLAQSRQIGYGRYMGQIDAARRAQLLQAQQKAQQQAGLSQGLFGLGGSLLGASIFHGRAPGVGADGAANDLAGVGAAGAGGGGYYDVPQSDYQWSDL